MGQDKNSSRASHANFIGIERRVADSQAFTTLTHLGRALYVDLRRQFNGRNNGDICAADFYLLPYGWAHSSIHRALKELVAHGLIEQTRKGGIGAMSRTPSLYAFTDLAVVGNPAKGIQGSQASRAYHDFVPDASPNVKKQSEGTNRGRNSVTAEPMKVHTVN